MFELTKHKQYFISENYFPNLYQGCLNYYATALIWSFFQSGKTILSGLEILFYDQP